MFAKRVSAARASGAASETTLLGKIAEGTTTKTEQQTLAFNPGHVKAEPEEGELGFPLEEDDYEDDDDEEEEMVDREENSEDEDDNLELQVKKPRLLPDSVSPFCLPPYSTSPSNVVKKTTDSSPTAIKQEPEDKEFSPVRPYSFTSPNGFTDWGYDEPLKQKGNVGWADESEGGKGRAEPSRDFAKLYDLDNDPNRKEFLDQLFVFMQKRGTPVNRIPIMAKQVLDLYMLYKLVTEKGGLVEVINKKIWREITKGLNLPTSITSAAFTLRTQYMKYLYPFECEKKGLSSQGELQAAIDSNRREGRRPSYSNSLYRFSPSPSAASHTLLSPPKVQTVMAGANGLHSSPIPSLKRNTDETSTPMMPSRLPMSLAQQQQQQLAQATALEHLREKLERGGGGAEGPERKPARLSEEQQRLMQQAFQQNLLAMASHFNPAILKLNNGHDNTKQDMSLRISTNGAASISMSMEVNGVLYSGMLYAQKSLATPAVSEVVTPAGTTGFSALSFSDSPSSSSSSSSFKEAN
ncbi:AT-rich interactive domain-containing protein 3B [Aplochiton taeniatus]